MGAAEVLDLDLGVARTIVDDLEGPRLLVLLDDGVLVATTDKAPVYIVVRPCPLDASAGLWRGEEGSYLTSKTVFRGFMAAWFFAASPIRRSSSVKDTKEGVVKLPCSLAMISTLVPS